MPRTATEAKPSSGAGAETQLLSASIFPALVMAAYLVLCLPALALWHFDPGVLVHAGDRYVNSAATEAPLPVRKDSSGYDGQFYYRMALHPFSLAPVQGGITFDHPAKRMERFIYPLLAWLISIGHPARISWALFAINLCGLGAIAFTAQVIARQMRLPATMALAMVLWPGLMVALLYDTAEITSMALLLSAVWAYLGNRLALYAALAACATLARETTLPAFLGILAYEAWMARTTQSRWPRVVACAGALVPFAVWRQMLTVMAHAVPQAQGMSQDIGWPFMGAAQILWGCLTGARHWANTPLKDAAIRAIILLTAPGLLLFCGLVLVRMKAVFRQEPLRALAIGWLLTAALMSLLTAAGPWIDPISYYRAFTECFAAGCILLFAGGFAPGASSVALFGGTQLLLTWSLCLAKLR